MSELARELKELRERDSDVAEILDVFIEIERVYAEMLEAMGAGTGKQTFEVENSAEVTISFSSSGSSSA